MKRIFTVAIVTSFLLPGALGLRAQPQSAQPAVTDADVASAFSASGSTAQRRLAIARATQLPPHTLSERSIKSIANELSQVVATEAASRAAYDRGQPLQPAQLDERAEGSDYKPELIQILARQRHPAGIDALADVVETGTMAQDALLEFGDQAVPALVRVAGMEDPYKNYYHHMAFALDVLEQMFDPNIRPTLSSTSRQAIQKLAREHMANSGDRWMLLANAARLGIATGDRDLRKQATDLIGNNPEFVRRGIDAQHQLMTTQRVQNALEKFPER